MTEKQTPAEKQPITVTESTEAPFLLYAGDDEKVHVRVLIHAETLWLPQRLMADLFQTTPDNIGLHLRNIYAEGELAEKATAEDFSVVQNEGGRGVRRTLKHYSLDAIIAVGYRVSSKRATQFRIWATQILKEYIRKGFVLDDERLKQGKHFGNLLSLFTTKSRDASPGRLRGCDTGKNLSLQAMEIVDGLPAVRWV
jgi:hypothetical protein